MKQSDNKALVIIAVLSLLSIGQDGTVWAKGANDYGQPGDGRMVYEPTRVSK